MATKFPPPPFLTDQKFQSLNRWLLDVSSILNSEGTIDPGTVNTLPETTTQVGDNTTSIATINGEITTLNGLIAAINASIASLSGQVAVLAAAVLVLQANPVVRFGAGAPAAGLGGVGDWYGDPAGIIGSRIWIKTAVGVWTAFPL